MVAREMRWVCDLMMRSLQTGIEKSFSYFISYWYSNLKSPIIKKETTFFILQNMFRHSYVIFSCKCSTVAHLNFHCIHDYVIELRHKISHVNNLNIGILNT